MNFSQRNLLIACAVVLLHAAALWALQAGLVHRPTEILVPVEVLTELITAAQPQPTPAPVPPVPAKPRVQEQIEKAPAAPPRRVTRPQPTPSPEPLTPAATAQPIAPAEASVAAPAEPASQAPTPAEPPKVEPPSSNADYLQNPPPVYPAISKRLGEQGNVIVRVLIGSDGRPRRAELKRSSGFERLDRTALEYVMNCRYAPGKVNGVPQDMWYDAPVRFVLE